MKRENDELAGNSGKRAKLNGDDLWGDSDSDVDDFLLQASQVVELKQPTTGNNQFQIGSCTLGYNGFNKFSMVASTQFETSFQQVPSTSRTYNNGVYEELKQLKEQVLVKDGEVSILRSKLKQTKEEIERTHLLRNNETLEKLNVVQKERDKYCTELDFKNMEIVNLRRKLANVTKNLFDNTTNNENNCSEGIALSSELSKFQTINYVNDEDDDNCDKEIVPFLGTYKPLESVIPFEIFESNEDDIFPKLSTKKDAAGERYLHCLMFSSDNGRLPRGIFTYLRYKETLKLKHFFGPIRLLKQALNTHLDNETKAINQIYLMTYTFLNNQLEFLKIFDKKIQIDEIRDSDLRHLQQPNRNVSLNFSLLQPKSFDNTIQECGIQCRQGIALLAIIYPYSNYLRHIILRNKLSQVSDIERTTWCYNFPKLFSTGTDFNLLKLLVNVITSIGQNRQSTLYTGLLCATSDLLSQIIQFKLDKPELYHIIHNLAKQIILTNPTYPVLYYLSEFFIKSSTCPEFVGLLCSMPVKSHVQKKLTKGIVLVNAQCCTIEMYFNLCREALPYLLNNEDNFGFRMHLNLLNFAINAISCNVKWMYFTSDNVHFDCQREYYKLVINVIHVSLTKYKMLKGHRDKDISDDLITIVKLSPKVLNSLNQTFLELIEIDQQYNAIFKNCQAILQDLLPIFTTWNDFEVESIRNKPCDSSPATVKWDSLELESLRI